MISKPHPNSRLKYALDSLPRDVTDGRTSDPRRLYSYSIIPVESRKISGHYDYLMTSWKFADDDGGFIRAQRRWRELARLKGVSAWENGCFRRGDLARRLCHEVLSRLKVSYGWSDDRDRKVYRYAFAYAAMFWESSLYCKDLHHETVNSAFEVLRDKLGYDEAVRWCSATSDHPYKIECCDHPTHAVRHWSKGDVRFPSYRLDKYMFEDSAEFLTVSPGQTELCVDVENIHALHVEDETVSYGTNLYVKSWGVRNGVSTIRMGYTSYKLPDEVAFPMKAA